MSFFLLSAAGLTVAIAMVHSVLGEHRIFRRLRGARSPDCPGFKLVFYGRVGICSACSVWHWRLSCFAWPRRVSWQICLLWCGVL